MRSLLKKPRVAAGGLLLLLAGIEFALHAPVLLGTVALYQRDLFLLYFPLVQSVLKVLSEGAWPLRDPTSAFGQPLLADPSCQILYPPVLIHLFLPPHQAYAWFVSIHSVFGAMGVALLARRFAGGSWLAALVAGVSWLTCGPLQSLATLWHHMAGAAWIPWVLLFLDDVVARRGERSSVLALGAVFGLQILAGSADMCAMTLLLAALFVTPLGLTSCKTWLASFSLALLLSAGVWLPAAELVSASARSALNETTRTYWSLHPLSLIELFLPVPLNALPLLKEWRLALFEGREPFLASVFLGVAVLPLAVAALADGAVSRGRRLASLIGVLSGLLIALGKNAVAYAWLVALIPPLKILRFPSKAVVPVAVLTCVLAGAGAVSITRSSRSRRFALAAILVLMLAALTLAGPLQAAFTRLLLDPAEPLGLALVERNLPAGLLLGVGLLGLLAACLRWFRGRAGLVLAAAVLAGHIQQSATLRPGATVPSELLSYRPENLDLFRPPGDGRLFVYDYAMYQGRAQRYLGREDVALPVGLPGLAPDAANMIALRAYLIPLVGAFWGIEYAWDADLRYLFDRRLASLTIGLRRTEGAYGFRKLLQISGVSRVASLHEAGMEDLTLLQRRRVFYPEDLRIFAVPDPLPRAFLVSGRARGRGSDLDNLISGDFDPATTVLVDEGPERPPIPGFSGEARIVARRADRITVETSANAPAFLGVIEGAMPGWRAWVDGRSAKVERANALFVGTEVPAGTHRVEFRFLPGTAVLGLTLSGLTALFLVLSLLTARGRNPAD